MIKNGCQENEIISKVTEQVVETMEEMQERRKKNSIIMFNVTESKSQDPKGREKEYH